MQKVLVINHHSVSDLAEASTSFDECKSILDRFFGTWQTAVTTNVAESFVVCDSDLWMLNFCDGKTMDDYISSQDRTNTLFIFQLLKITKQTTLNYFPDDVFNVIQETDAFVPDHNHTVPIVGCTSMSDAAALLSLATKRVWASSKINITWRPENIKDVYPFLCDYCDNFSDKSHVTAYVSRIEDLAPISRAKFEADVPGAIITDKFWCWFETLGRSVQNFLFEKARFCAGQGWMARRGSPFQVLAGTRNSLAEIRAWPLGKTLRIYVKKENDDRVLFLAGSDKACQAETIAIADRYYSDHREEL